MAPTVPRRLPYLGLLAGCLAVLPFLRDPVGHSAAFLPACLTAVVACDLLTAALLALQFRARGSAPLLGLACAYLFAGLLSAAHALALPGALCPHGVLGAPDPPAACRGPAGRAGLPVVRAPPRWGAPPALRRRLAPPTTRRGRVLAVTLGG